MSSGREPISLNFRVTASSSSRFAPSPGYKEMMEGNSGRRKEETTEKTRAVRRTEKAEKSSEEGVEGTAGSVLAAACQWQARETLEHHQHCETPQRARRQYAPTPPTLYGERGLSRPQEKEGYRQSRIAQGERDTPESQEDN
ncbi:hypothetical protein NDU88_005311 [Pleurodeles waltl]|uniref:Uncharacterized protein n=1 Tax=Pleurodeles waltl TaxID=8319 RepID=A0AAV7MVX5_PLEWA|nr:hypothetical protein NDU88_005311 [Pleurodeles waltl]